MASSSTGIDHLVVLVHGLWGNPVHLHNLRNYLQKEHEGAGIDVLIPEANSGYLTYDGIELGGERITKEIEDRIEEVEAAGSKIKKISVVGYSLGGLVARYAVGLLYKNGIFDTIQPVNFTTFATPHLGVRSPAKGVTVKAWNWIGSGTLSTSGAQMFLVDRFRDTGRPLLAVMADANSIFIRGLKMFKNKTLYANTVNDRSVPFYTSFLSRTDPFVDLEMIDVKYLDGQGDDPVLLDPNDPAVPHRRPKPSSSLGVFAHKAREALPFYALFFSVMPIAVPLFFINAGYQTFKSGRRMRLHEAGGAATWARYRIPVLEEAQAMQDRMMERLATEQTKLNEEYLPTPPPETAGSSMSSASSSSASAAANDLAAKESRKNTSPFPTLALSKEQFAMIDVLDSMGFVKYPAHIIKVRHTHAAIIVRVPKESFREGVAVVEHWARGFEV